MSRIHARLAKFSFVGVIGIGVQLLVLAALTRLKTNYLLATFLAVEAAVLHNFLWHQRFTWIDRDLSQSTVIGRLLRFHISNGLISFIGNLSIMRLLVGSLRVPVLIANGIAIAACALVNFLVSDRWVFKELVAESSCAPLCSLWLGSSQEIESETGLSYLPRTFSHQNQRALRERKVNKSRRNAESQT